MRSKKQRKSRKTSHRSSKIVRLKPALVNKFRETLSVEVARKQKELTKKEFSQWVVEKLALSFANTTVYAQTFAKQFKKAA